VRRAQLPWETPRALGLHGQVFLNGGSAELLSGTGRPLRQAAHDFLRTFRWSAARALPQSCPPFRWYELMAMQRGLGPSDLQGFVL